MHGDFPPLVLFTLFTWMYNFASQSRVRFIDRRFLRITVCCTYFMQKLREQLLCNTFDYWFLAVLIVGENRASAVVANLGV